MAMSLINHFPNCPNYQIIHSKCGVRRMPKLNLALKLTMVKYLPNPATRSTIAGIKNCEM
jgi:hypothetical protein